jgi:hypothetical protein
MLSNGLISEVVMRRWFRLALLLTVLATCAILATRLIGGTRASALAPLFTMPDQSACVHPCLFGVQPGYTTIDAAAAILSAHLALKSYEAVRVDSPVGVRLHLEDPSGTTVDVFGSADGQVDAITTGQKLPIQSIGKLGDVVSLFNAPGHLLIDNALGLAAFFEKANLFIKGRHTLHKAGSDQDRLSMGDVVQLVVVYRSGECTQYSALLKANTAFWLGFAPVAKYQQFAHFETILRYLMRSDIAVPCHQSE